MNFHYDIFILNIIVLKYYIFRTTKKNRTMKNMFKVAFVAAFICMAGYSVYASQQEIELSELAS